MSCTGGFLSSLIRLTPLQSSGRQVVDQLQSVLAGVETSVDEQGRAVFSHYVCCESSPDCNGIRGIRCIKANYGT